MIEQGAMFEGSCKMTQAKTATDAPPKVERKENVLDASKLESVRADAARKAEETAKPAATAVAK